MIGARARCRVSATPRCIGGLLLWVRFDVGVTTVSGKVSQINDQSGGGNNLTQATAGNRPVYNSAPINGKPSASFDNASSTYLESAAAALAPTAALTFSIVGRYTGALAAIELWGGRGDTGSQGYWFGADGAAGVTKWNLGNGATAVRKSFGTLVLNTVYACTGVFDGANTTGYLTGVSTGSSAIAGPVTYVANPNFYLGAITGLVANRFFTGDIGESWLYDSALSSRKLDWLLEYQRMFFKF